MCKRARRAEEEPNMPLLLWYLPFIILSAAYESGMNSHDEENVPS
jgi:hypothetical protein